MDVITAIPLKKLVITLLALLMQRLLPVPAPRSLSVTRTVEGSMALRALTHLLSACAGRMPDATAGLSCQNYKSQEAGRPKTSHKRPDRCRIAQKISNSDRGHVSRPCRLSPMAFKSSVADAGRRVPESDRMVPAAGRKKPAVGCKGHGPDGTAATSLKKKELTILALLQVQRLLPVQVASLRSTVAGFTGPEGSHPWPSKVRWQTPQEGSQRRIVLSSLPDARSRPSAAKATERTELLKNC
jgi:hypothetical protein